MPDPGVELQHRDSQVVHPVTGELLNLDGESPLGLALLASEAQDYRAALADFERALGDRLLEHLDASAKWTMRVGEPTDDVQFEITAPSPTAGTESYPVDTLETQLRLLIDNRTITPDAASGACKRHLVLTLEVPWGVDVHALAENAKGVRFHIAGSDVAVLKADVALKAVAAGITALRKVPGTANALDAARRITPAGVRKVKVTMKGPGS